jgi:hypothetical protein
VLLRPNDRFGVSLHRPNDLESVAFTCDRGVHLLPEVDKQAATKLEAVRAATCSRDVHLDLL